MNKDKLLKVWKENKDKKKVYEWETEKYKEDQKDKEEIFKLRKEQ